MESHTLIRLNGFLLPPSLMTQTNWIHQMCSRPTWWLTLRCVMIVLYLSTWRFWILFSFLWLKVQDCLLWFLMKLNQLWNRKKNKNARAVWHVLVVSLARKVKARKMVAQAKLWISLHNCSYKTRFMDTHSLYYQPVLPHQYYYSD